MKKLVTITLLFVAVHLLAGPVQTVSKSVSDLEAQYGWQHDSTYLSFQLDEAITITGTQGNAKYCSDNYAKSMRYYQGCRKGEFAIEAQPGVVIQSVRLTYYTTTDNSIVALAWENNGKSVKETYRLKSDEELMVNASKISLYTGRTVDGTNGQVRITQFEVSYVRIGDGLISCTTQELANQYGWADTTCLRNFDLNDAISVDVEKDRTMKYTMNTQSFHCYQWLGGFTIKANGDRIIKSVKLTYGTVNKGVMTQHWGKDGKQIAPEDQIASDSILEVNASSVTFYVGNTDTINNGQIRIKAWEVIYTEPHTNDMMMRSAMDLGKQYGWQDETCPVHVTLNSALSLHSDKTNNMKFYSTTRSFHCYQWGGGIYFKSREGSVIKTVTLMYESLNNGVLTQYWGAAGKNIPEEYWIASGTQLIVNSDSVHFNIGNKDTTNNCQIHLTGFNIQYLDTLAHMETLAQCTTAGSEEIVSVRGDQGYYQWSLNHFQRTTEDYVGTFQGTRLMFNGTIASDSVLEGGVKDVSFDWRAADGTKPVHFMVKAGETTENISQAAAGANRYVMNFTKQLGIQSNCAFSVSVGAQESTAQDFAIVGPITITPYLLFKQVNHIDTIDTNSDSYDLNPTLINNAGEVPVFEVMENTTGQEVTITNGVVNLQDILHGGYIKVKASCFAGAVSTTLTLYIEVAPRVFFQEQNKVVYVTDLPFVNPLIALDSIGAVTYSSSDTRVAMVNDTGLVTIMGLGQAVITAHVAATEMYVATSTSFILSVIFIPQEGTYRIETFSQCKKKKVTSGFAYVEGDDAVYDWNLTNFSRDKQDSVGNEQGILLYYGGSIASNGAQEGGVKYLSFDWRAIDPMAPVHFMVNIATSSVSYSQSAVGDASQVLTYSNVFAVPSNAALSISLRQKENPAQSQIVVGPLTIVPYLLFTNKYVELSLPQTSYDCASELINNTESVGSIVYTILSDPSAMATLDGSVLDLSKVTEPEDIQLQATWGEVSTTMTLHLTESAGLNEMQKAECTMQNGKVLRNGELWIYKNGLWYTILGSPKK